MSIIQNTFDFEERKAARIERLREKAQDAREESDARYTQARSMANVIPFGQPIHIGHHSEKGDRAYRSRIDAQQRKSYEAAEKAKHYERKAEAAENNTAISSSDPHAVAKLRKKLAGLEDDQATMKADNRILRKAKVTIETADKDDVMRSAGVSDSGIRSLVHLARICPYHCTPYLKHPSYSLTNNNSNIKRVRARIEELEKRAATHEAPPVEFDGFTISEDTDWGRILIEFDGKPAADIRSTLKGDGWRWAPSRLAWVRHLNDNGQAAAKRFVEAMNR